jgi:hypothetical protein
LNIKENEEKFEKKLAKFFEPDERNTDRSRILTRKSPMIRI